MHHELHAAAFVKEALQHESFLRWNGPQAFVYHGQVRGNLFSRRR